MDEDLLVESLLEHGKEEAVSGGQRQVTRSVLQYFLRSLQEKGNLRDFNNLFAAVASGGAEASQCVPLSCHLSEDPESVLHTTPHTLAVQIWRWPELPADSMLWSVPSCQYPTTPVDGCWQACINPYHHERVFDSPEAISTDQHDKHEQWSPQLKQQETSSAPMPSTSSTSSTCPPAPTESEESLAESAQHHGRLECFVGMCLGNNQFLQNFTKLQLHLTKHHFKN